MKCSMRMNVVLTNTNNNADSTLSRVLSCYFGRKKI